MFSKLKPIVKPCLVASLVASLSLALGASVSPLGGDTDSDGSPNAVDLDDDNDGLADSGEVLAPVEDLDVWSNAVNGVSASGNSITYDGTGGPGFNSQINSATLASFGLADNFRVSWRCATNPSGTFSLVGLGVTEGSPTLPDIELAIYNANGTLAIFENGVNMGIFGSVVAGSLLSIEFEAGAVTYQLDGSDLLSHSIATSVGAYIDTSFSGGAITYDQFKVEAIGAGVMTSADGDLLDNAVDLDSDNDGVLDIVEIGLADLDGDGLIDSPGDEGSVLTPVDSDSDGLPDFMDLESGNALNDGTAYDIAGTAFAALDTNGDGQLSAADTGGGVDADSDGIDDLIDNDPTMFGNALPDCDGDGIPDATDTDPDCNSNGIQDNCETFVDCNGNGVPDECDDDCDSNGTPDDCEPMVDCNGNSVPDRCDLSSGFSFDTDGDMIPDECQDCDSDGTPDSLEADCDLNGTPDDCEAMVDCNGNSVPDRCDISSGFSNDADGDMIPDDCQDCNNNGTPDSLDPDCDMNGIPDDCDGPCPPLASFSFTPGSGRAPLTVQFTDASFPAITSWAWDFGDGGTSTQSNPMHVYTTVGNFTPSLVVTNPAGSDMQVSLFDVVVSPFVLGFMDPNFELSTADAAPSVAWTVLVGSDVNVRSNALIGDAHLPTAGLNWLDISAAGSSAATAPTVPGGATTPSVGAAGVSQEFRFDTGATRLRFESAFLLNGTAGDTGFNDFMSVEVSDGVTTHNVYYADTFSAFDQTSPATGLAMTAVSNVEVDLATLFPSATVLTDMTLSVFVGNGGDGLNASRGYFDNVRLEIADHARARVLGCGTNPYGSLRFDGEPSFGEPIDVHFDNPLGTSCAGSTLVVAYISNQTVPLACGFPLAVYGMDGGGSELYLGVGTGFLVELVAPTWGGVGVPSTVTITTSFDATLIGREFYMQAAFIDFAAVCGTQIGLTECAELTLGL